MDIATSVNILKQRSSGILLPIFSLPGPYGIGDLGRSAECFIEFLQKSGQSCWQILPCGPTSAVFGNSPYMSYSAFAGSPQLIALDPLLEQKLLRVDEICLPEFSQYMVDYQKVAGFKRRLLHLASKRFQAEKDNRDRLLAFREAHPWTVDYGLFLLLKEIYRGQPWYAWPASVRQRQAQALKQLADQYRDALNHTLFEQYLFFSQWERMRASARSKGVHLIGDLPIYVALDSVDVWSNQDLFQLDPSTGEPTHVAGVPPDYFSVTGQRWGNPLYCWNSDQAGIRESLQDWWEQRLRLNFSLVDTLRIDHFRGFESYWAVPAAEETALNGTWQKGPGQPFFQEMERRLGGMSIIAEDLGLITPEVEQLRRSLRYPGMKILLFAFDGDAKNFYLPYNCDKDSVVYTGTHDNDTAVGWYLNPEVAPESKRQAKRFANREDDLAGSFHQDLIHLALGAASNLAILPMQDVLGFGNDCRMNTPGTTANNWRWRCADRFINDDLAAWLRDRTALFGRLPSIAPDTAEATAPAESPSSGG